ncbi:MAG: hypothetical protein OHK0046_15030 [Anaerolineae bacterium]
MRVHRFVPFLAVVIAIWAAALVAMVQESAAFVTDATCNLEIGTWQSASPSPNNHIEGASAVVNGQLYALAGFGSFSGTLFPTNKVTSYNPVTDTWTTSPNPSPIEASHMQGATDGRYIWTAGGFKGKSPGTATDEVWRYDTITDTWAPQTPLPEARASGGVVLLGRSLHYISGLKDRNNDTSTHWSLNVDDPNATWQTVSTFPRPRNHFQAVVLEGKIYTVGGQTNHDTQPRDGMLLDMFDPATGQWTVMADLPQARSHAEMGTFVTNERILMVGGRKGQDGENPLRTVLQYNPQQDKWTQIATLPKGLISPMANVVGNMLVVTTGGVNWYTPQVETWIAPILDNCSPARPSNVQVDGSLTQKTVRPAFTFTRPLNRDNSPAPADWHNLTLWDTNYNVLFDQWFQHDPVCDGNNCRIPLPEDQFPVGLLNGTYHAAVRSYANTGALTAYSEPKTFAVAVPAPATVTSVDVNVNNGQPIVTLPDDPGTTYAYIYIGGANGFVYAQWHPLLNCGSGQCEVITDAFLSNGDYALYVQVWGPGGYDSNAWFGPLSITVSFPAPAAPTGLSGSTNGSQTNLAWSSTPGATWYEVWVGSPDFQTTMHSSWYEVDTLTCGDSTCNLTLNENGSGLVWYVRGWGPAGYSTGGDVEGWSAGTITNS